MAEHHLDDAVTRLLGSQGGEECVDCGPGASEAPELRRSSCRCFADLGIDDAGLEESIRVGVALPVTLQRFDEHHRRDDRWPQLVVDE